MRSLIAQLEQPPAPPPDFHLEVFTGSFAAPRLPHIHLRPSPARRGLPHTHTQAMGGDLPDAVVRRINLIEVLMDAHPDCPEPPEHAQTLWSEEEIRSFFASEGQEVPSREGSTPADGVEAVGVTMGALDVNGEPLPVSTRPDGKYLCQRIGCSAVYEPEANPEGGCRYHAVSCVWRGTCLC